MNRQEDETRLKENMLHCMTEAALGGHNLGEWMPVAGYKLTFQVVCRQSDESVYVS